MEMTTMAYQYGPCSKPKAKRVYEPVKFPTPTLEDLDLALRDVSEMGWNCATEWSRYVIEWSEGRRS
jgi:hypothetical protein